MGALIGERVGRHYRRFRGNVRPANKENQTLGEQPPRTGRLNQGRVREVRLAIQGFDVHREFEFAVAGALGLNRHESQ